MELCACDSCTGPSKPICEPADYQIEPQCPSMRDIFDEVCRFYGVTRIDLCSARQSMDVTRPRQIAMFLTKETTLHSFANIARQFGGRDHTTALHACRKIKTLLEADEQIADAVQILRTRLEERIRQRKPQIVSEHAA